MGDGGSGEKSEEPTAERLRKLREDGNIPKSQDVTQAVMLMGGFGVLAVSFPYIAQLMQDFFTMSVYVATHYVSEEPGILMDRYLNQALLTFALMCAPLTGAALGMALVLNYAQVGFIFSLKPVTPDINKLNPVQGFKGLINKKKLVELIKNLIKFGVVAYLAYSILKDTIKDVVHIIRSPLPVGLRITGGMIWDTVLRIGGFFVVIAVADFIYQRKRFIKDNMMSKYDVKQEYKQSEGDPHQKAERKRFHHELLNSAPSSIKKADAVITNPHLIAVAIQYDKEKGGAPKIIAKGERVWAENIKASAKKYGIPILRNVPLAQALNKLELGEDIPEELYEAVAEVLSFVFKLQEEQMNKGKKR